MYSAIISNYVATVLALFNTIHSPGIFLTQSSRTGVIYFIVLYFMKDKNRTVSRRSEPNSRNFLMDEQSNPSKLVRQEVKLSRHRGAKQRLG